MVGWFRRFRPSPPPLVLFRVCRPPLFFSLALSGFARSGPGVLVWVFAPSLFFCVPLLRSRLSNLSSHFHFYLIFIPLFILIFTSLHANHPASGRVCGCVCVCTICRDVKLLNLEGRVAPMSYHTQAAGGTYIVSLLVYIVIVSCDF